MKSASLLCEQTRCVLEKEHFVERYGSWSAVSITQVQVPYKHRLLFFFFNNAERCVYPAVRKHILFILKTSRHTLPTGFELAFSEWEAGALTRMLDYSLYLLRPGFTRTAGLRYINNKCLQRLLITKFGYVNVI